MAKQIFYYHKSYIRSESRDNTGQLLQISHKNKIYNFSVERLVYRRFYEDDYKMYRENKKINTNQYRIVVYYNGENSIISNGKKIMCPEGTVLLLSPGEQPSITAKSRGEFDILVFNFDLCNQKNNFLDISFNKLMQSYSNQSYSNIQKKQLNKYELEKIISIFNEIFDYFKVKKIKSLNNNSLNFNNKYNNNFFLSEKILNLFTFIRNYIYTNEYSKTINPTIKRIIKIIEEKFNDKISIDKLANTACLSRTHFFNIFKENVGLTPIQYQRLLRINRAKELLISTSFSCKIIAEQVGYNNPYYFSRVFKKEVGTPPSEYRKKHRSLE